MGASSSTSIVERVLIGGRNDKDRMENSNLRSFFFL